MGGRSPRDQSASRRGRMQPIPIVAHRQDGEPKGPRTVHTVPNPATLDPRFLCAAVLV